MSETKHFVYETTNLVNAKFYIGKHSTTNINDGYLGSGLVLSQAIQKHSKENFKRTIIKFFDSSEEAFAYESEIVNEDLIENPLCYNVALGGISGGIHLPCVTDGVTTRRVLNPAEFLKTHPKWWRGQTKNFSEKRIAVNNGATGRHIPISELEDFLKSNPGWKKGTGVSSTEDRICVTDGYVDKYVSNPESFISSNPKWRIGSHSSNMRDTTFVTNGLENKAVKDTENFLNANPNWKIGFTRYSTKTVKNYICITNGFKTKSMPKVDADLFLNDNPDWKVGSSKTTNNNKVWVNNSTKQKMVNELENFLTNNPSWKRGMLPRK